MSPGNQLFDVVVDERVDPSLARHENVHYTSPAQGLESALALARLLGAGKLGGPGVARVAVAGGCRTVTIRMVEASADPAAAEPGLQD